MFLCDLLTRDVQETAAAKEQLKAIENRHADFLKLEASIREVHGMFIDINTLIQSQGEMVTRIEDYVNSKLDESSIKLLITRM